MTEITLTVRLVFGSGQEQVHTVETHLAQPLEQPQEEFQAPLYRFPSRTAPHEPTLVDSPSFAKIG